MGANVLKTSVIGIVVAPTNGQKSKIDTQKSLGCEGSNAGPLSVYSHIKVTGVIAVPFRG